MLENIKTIKRLIQRWIVRARYVDSLPVNPRNDDIYIVEFPKSGITWLTAIISNLMLRMDGGLEQREKITAFNRFRYIPDVHQLRGAMINENTRWRFIKSHSGYNPYYFMTIYLLRNPYDVMVSYYNFQREAGYDLDFLSFVKSDKYGIQAWVGHVEGWLNRTTRDSKLHLVKYEDMQNNPEGTIGIMLDNIGLVVDGDDVAWALKKSSLQSMKHWENLVRSNNPSYNRSLVGKNNKLARKDIMTSEVVEYINGKAGHLIAAFYPEFLNNSDS